MKKFITFFLPLIFSIQFACFDDASSDNPEYNRITELTITGTCPFISVNNEYNYHNLPTTPLILRNRFENKHQVVYYIIEKYTNDATSVTAVLKVDNVTVQTLTTTDAYGYVEISYTIEPI